jgi:hypothetical protein
MGVFQSYIGIGLLQNNQLYKDIAQAALLYKERSFLMQGSLGHSRWNYHGRFVWSRFKRLMTLQ